MAKFIDRTGQIFGRLTVVAYGGKNKHGQSLWNCLCDCGTEITIQGGHLKSGHTQSCGCFKIEKVKEVNTKHGHSTGGNGSPTYYSWQGMIQRCTNSNYKHYMDWGGRGIAVCDRWLKFENFLEDMEEKPSKEHSIDRIDNERGYCKENCQWSTTTEQQRNKRTNVWLTFNGETKLQADWGREWGLRPSSICQFLQRGHSMEWIYENKKEN